MAQLTALFVLFLCILGVPAQFNNIFEQFFHGQQQQQQQHHQPQNAPSDPSQYQEMYRKTHCTNYLCPDTLACVDNPNHCPCPHPAHEDKFDLGLGSIVCVSKGGYKDGEAARKVELARKGLL